MKLTAIVIGATGMTGNYLVKQLLLDGRFQRVITLVRRRADFHHKGVEENVVDFDQPETWEHIVKGDVLFSCMGTTLKTAGSKEAQYQIDYTYQYRTAKTAAENGVSSYVLVSSLGADAQSKNFYLRMKGELDEAVQKLSFRHIHILRPGPLTGDRKENRPMEKTALALIRTFNTIGLLLKFRPVHGNDLALGMIHASMRNTEKPEIYELKKLIHLIKGKL